MLRTAAVHLWSARSGALIGMLRRARYLLLLALLPLAASIPGQMPGVIDPVIHMEAVPIAPDPARRRVGALTYLEGWVLTSRDSRFGGISSMRVSGDRVLALNDAGAVFRFRIARGRAIDIGFDSLPMPSDKAVRKGGRDSESLTGDAGGRHLWAGFESTNQIRRFDGDLRRLQRIAAPQAMKAWPENSGPEAMVALRDGRFLVFSEEARQPNASNMALLFAGDPTLPGAFPLRFGYRPPEGYLATDAAELPDGRVLLLNRRATLLDGFSAALTLIDPAAIRANGVVEGIELARLASPLTVDNMEALALTQEGGRTVVWLASDDNFMPFERTLLLRFALGKLPQRTAVPSERRSR